MAYASVISLKQTIQRLVNSSHISIVSHALEILEFANKDVDSLLKLIKRFDESRGRSISSSSSSRKKLIVFEERVRVAVHKLADSLEFRVSDHFGAEASRDLNLEGISQDFYSFAATVKKLQEDYDKELDNPSLQEDEEKDDVASSTNDFCVKMVGLSKELMELKNHMFNIVRPDDFCVFSVVGEEGTGRTFVAKTIFEECCINQEQLFDCGAWVTIGPKYQLREILVSIISQIDDKSILVDEDEGILLEHLHTSLKDKRFMIVLDDVRDELYDHLRGAFPPQNNGSLILLTTAFMQVALYAYSYFICELRVFDDEILWDFINFTMFVLNSCPLELEYVGKKIVKNCRGLRIPFIKAVLFLCKGEKTVECWNEIAEDGDNCIFLVEDEISEMCKIKEDLQQLSFPDDDHRSLTIKLVKQSFLEASNQKGSIKANMFPARLFPKLEITSLYGMAGIGKTRFVKEVFEDPVILRHFDHWAWITLGPLYQSKEILVDILTQIYHGIDKRHIKEDETLAKGLCEKLYDKRCLIVLDDIWSQEPLHYLKMVFPNIKGKALVTSRLTKVAQFGEHDKVHEMRLLNKDESWCLLREEVFGERRCPFNLERVGRKIAENCDGLPLTILMVGHLLSNGEKTPEYWSKVAQYQNSVFADAYKEISKVLHFSYESLPQHLKACFLYLGVFMQNLEIPSSKIINLLTAEGLLLSDQSQTVENFGAECLWELVERNLVMVCKKGSNPRIKTCRLHSVFWQLCNSEAVKNKFFRAFNTFDDSSVEAFESQRRLCFRNSILSGFKDVCRVIVSSTSASSVLFTCPPHQYPVPIFFGLKLIKVLDALSIRLYEFPDEVVKLIHLRYLALTCDGMIPTSISKLGSLEFFIISQHLTIRNGGDLSYLPVEIWDMKELKYVQIKGRNLPKPNGGKVLPNLFTLLGVGAQSCTDEVLKGIPNLKELGIQIELAPHGYGKPFCHFDLTSHLHKLESLKCVVVNPELNYEVVSALSMFPIGLRKLTLSGLGYPWEYMSIVGKLNNLEVLKIRCYAFQGPEWATSLLNFNKVKYLSIEDADLVHWKLSYSSFANLETLCFKHCYQLEDLPCALSSSVKNIEVVDCNPVVGTWAEQVKNSIKLQITSSWDAGSLDYLPSTWFSSPAQLHRGSPTLLQATHG